MLGSDHPAFAEAHSRKPNNSGGPMALNAFVNRRASKMVLGRCGGRSARSSAPVIERI
jgi:hypothetical protein